MSVIQIATCFIKRNIKVEVNHYYDVDVLAWLPDGPLVFEYQTPGFSDPKILAEKRKIGESKYVRLLFLLFSHLMFMAGVAQAAM